ncbi:hypothetical protein FPQ18DRAFT_393586 [Pyronema domesticum]|uniref:Uncharacterized protein n=1 Tax=Pyronema omphalodes (strain CBS 100304) TaxID=1076935 RepID=U4KZ11_PYROM|nr:hypothetical protein FPQ18DRAFT_393586 [Pyronema domesticum]CCX07256.1 Protein of unknown function [Pyronema omphalodes CBS 100304]
MASTKSTPTTSSKHGMTMRGRTPKPKPTAATSAAHNKAHKSSKVTKVSKAPKETKATKTAKTTKASNASKNNNATKPKKLMARYIFSPKALETINLYKNKPNAEFVDGYVERSNKEQTAGIEITVSVSEEYQFLKWTKDMVFRDLMFAKELGMEMEDEEFRSRWENEEME